METYFPFLPYFTGTFCFFGGLPKAKGSCYYAVEMWSLTLEAAALDKIHDLKKET